jgi:hypothetical protein
LLDALFLLKERLESGCLCEDLGLGLGLQAKYWVTMETMQLSITFSMQKTCFSHVGVWLDPVSICWCSLKSLSLFDLYVTHEAKGFFGRVSLWLDLITISKRSLKNHRESLLDFVCQ